MPLSAYYTRKDGTPRGQCKSCDKAAVIARQRERYAADPEYRERLLARQRARYAAERPAWKIAHAERMKREREARRLARAAELDAIKAEPKPAPMVDRKLCRGCAEALPLSAFGLKRGRPHSRCRSCRSKEALARYHADPERIARRAQRAAKRAERETRELAALLARFDDDGSEEAYQAWTANTRRLQKLWERSGPKTCRTCRQELPAGRFWPPTPGNTYPGRCIDCARQEYRLAALRTFGRERTAGAPRVRQRDGTAITVAEIARRHRAREAEYLRQRRLLRYGS